MNELTNYRKTQIQKMLAFVAVMILLPVSVCAQSWCFNYKGSWSSWIKNKDYFYYHNYDVAIYGNRSGCVLKANGGIIFFDFQITNYVAPSKKEIKEHRKSGKWFEYVGTVSYYVNDEYPTAEALAKACVFVTPNPRQDVTPTVKRSTSARIKVAPYKKYPEVYNIWFDKIGVGINIRGLKFEK